MKGKKATRREGSAQRASGDGCLDRTSNLNPPKKKEMVGIHMPTSVQSSPRRSSLSREMGAWRSSYLIPYKKEIRQSNAKKRTEVTCALGKKTPGGPPLGRQKKEPEGEKPNKPQRFADLV